MSELLNIKVKNINFDRMYILLNHTKGKVNRKVPFNHNSWDVLKNYIDTLDNTSDCLIDMTTDGVGSIFYRIRESTDIKAYAQALRHNILRILLVYPVLLKYYLFY